MVLGFVSGLSQFAPRGSALVCGDGSKAEQDWDRDRPAEGLYVYMAELKKSGR